MVKEGETVEVQAGQFTSEPTPSPILARTDAASTAR